MNELPLELHIKIYENKYAKKIINDLGHYCNTACASPVAYTKFSEILGWLCSRGLCNKDILRYAGFEWE